jgi:hypothetical protein
MNRAFMVGERSHSDPRDREFGRTPTALRDFPKKLMYWCKTILTFTRTQHNVLRTTVGVSRPVRRQSRTAKVQKSSNS